MVPALRMNMYDCSYKTRLIDYRVEGQGTLHEIVKLDSFAERKYLEKMKIKTKTGRLGLAAMPLLPPKVDR